MKARAGWYAELKARQDLADANIKRLRRFNERLMIAAAWSLALGSFALLISTISL